MARKKTTRRRIDALDATAESLGAALGHVAARLDAWKRQRNEIAADIQKASPFRAGHARRSRRRRHAAGIRVPEERLAQQGRPAEGIQDVGGHQAQAACGVEAAQGRAGVCRETLASSLAPDHGVQVHGFGRAEGLPQVTDLLESIRRRPDREVSRIDAPFDFLPGQRCGHAGVVAGARGVRRRERLARGCSGDSRRTRCRAAGV